MSILQEYEEIRSDIGYEEFDTIQKYLDIVSPMEQYDKYNDEIREFSNLSGEEYIKKIEETKKKYGVILLSDVLDKQDEWEKYFRWFSEEYKKRNAEILDAWISDDYNIKYEAVLSVDNKPVAHIISTCWRETWEKDLNKLDKFKDLAYSSFDKLTSLPKISKCSKLLQDIYDTVCQSDSKMCHITDDDWKELYSDEYSDKDIEELKKEVKELGIDKVITFNDAEYKIIGWGDLEMSFNDDRNISIDKDYNNVDKDYNNVKDNPDIEMGNLFRFDNYICEIDDYNQDNPNESIVFIYESLNKFEDRDYLEQVSLLNKNIKENLEDYMEEKYDVKIVTKLSILREMQDMTSHNLSLYSNNYLMSEPKKGFEREWRIESQKNHLLEQMIREEENKKENKQQEKWKEVKLI